MSTLLRLCHSLLFLWAEGVREFDANIPHKADLYMLGFLDAVAFIFDKDRAQVIRDTQAYRSERNDDEERKT